jgi:hypothetical protein
MTTAELIQALQKADPEGSRTVCIDAVGFKGGIGNSWANLPRILKVCNGIDWHNCMVMLQLTKPVRFNEKAKQKKA